MLHPALTLRRNERVLDQRECKHIDVELDCLVVVLNNDRPIADGLHDWVRLWPESELLATKSTNDTK
jgi:hypothetical protein